MSQIGCFSFYPTKDLGGAGDGGMVTTGDDKLAEKLRLLRVHGMEPRHYHGLVGVNSRLDAFQAAILNVKLPHLDRWTDMRTECADRYTALFHEGGARPARRSAKGNAPPPPRLEPVRRADSRRATRPAPLLPGRGEDRLGNLLPPRASRAAVLPLSRLPPRRPSETDRATSEVLALPIYPGLTAEEQATVVARITQFYAGPAKGHKLAGPNYLKHRSLSPKNA